MKEKEIHHSAFIIHHFKEEVLSEINPTVMKFGGTSVGDVAAFERVFTVVSAQLERRPVVVVSAMTRVTDALLAAFEMAKKGDAAGASESLEPHYARHVEVAE